MISEYFSGQRARSTPESEDRQSGNVQGRRAVCPGIGYADVQRGVYRMIADVRLITAGAAEPGNASLVEHIIQPSDTGNVDFRGIEQLLTPRDRLARPTDTAVPVQLVPCIVQFECFWGEGCSGPIVSEGSLIPMKNFS